MGRCDRAGHADPVRVDLLGAQGLHRRARATVVAGQAQRQGGLGVRRDLFAAWWQRVDPVVDVHADGALGLIIVPLGYADAAMFKAGTPYGATHVSKLDTVEPDAEHLDVARFQGRRVATVAR